MLLREFRRLLRCHHYLCLSVTVAALLPELVTLEPAPAVTIADFGVDDCVVKCFVCCFLRLLDLL